MSHLFGELRIRLYQQVNAFASLYAGASPRAKNFLWVTLGGSFGYLLALHHTNRFSLLSFLSNKPQQESVQKACFTTKYEVTESETKLFENLWNNSSRKMQSSEGYLYTQLFKKVPQGHENYFYVQLDAWRDASHREKWIIGEAAQAQLKQLKDASLSMQNVEYATVFDDSKRRMIPS